jgi:hypothetical protein
VSVADCPCCGRPEREHALILYAGGPEALPEATGKAAEKARKLTPAVRDASAIPKPSVARSGTGTTARRLNAKQAAQAKAWRKLADERRARA